MRKHGAIVGQPGIELAADITLSMMILSGHGAARVIALWTSMAARITARLPR